MVGKSSSVSRRMEAVRAMIGTAAVAAVVAGAAATLGVMLGDLVLELPRNGASPSEEDSLL